MWNIKFNLAYTRSYRLLHIFITYLHTPAYKKGQNRESYLIIETSNQQMLKANQIRILVYQMMLGPMSFTVQQ